MRRSAAPSSKPCAKGLCDAGWAPELNGDEKFFQMPPRPEPPSSCTAGCTAGAGLGGSLPPLMLEREGIMLEVVAQPPSARQISTARIVRHMELTLNSTRYDSDRLCLIARCRPCWLVRPRSRQ